jgi:hypothetical protein
MDPGPIGIRGLRKLKTLIDCRVFGLIRPNSSYPRGSSLISGGIWCMEHSAAGANGSRLLGALRLLLTNSWKLENMEGKVLIPLTCWGERDVVLQVDGKAGIESWKRTL